MSDIAIDPVTGDLLLEQGRARLAVGAEAVAQSWASHLTMFRGECFLDQSLGIDYQREILIKGARPAVLRAIFARATRETPGVREVKQLRCELDAAHRVLRVRAEVVRDTGEAQVLQLAEPIGG